MEHSYILSILYEMALVIGGEISVKPLLTKMLQRLLYHTSFPAGFVCLGVSSAADSEGMLEVRIDAAVGDYELTGLIGQKVRLPAQLLHGAAECGEDAALLAALPDKINRYKAYLRLPIDGQGVVVLLAPQLPDSDLPLTQLFQPVMANLAKAILLCSYHDTYTGGLIAACDASQLALAASEEKFRAISTAALDALIMVDESSALVYWNPAAERILGYRADEVIGKPLHQLLTPPRYQSKAIQGFNAFRSTGQGAVIGKTIEIEALHKDGHEIPIELSISALKLNEHWHAVGMLRDISERKRADEALRASEERLHLATTAGNIGVWDWDIVNNQLAWDESMYALYGVRKENFGGAYEAWSGMLHPDDRQYTEGEIQAALHGEREYAPEFRIVHPDGAIRNIKAASKTYHDLQGNPIRMVGINIDISERKKAEEELRRYKDHLEEVVQQRTADLVLARNAAEAANRAKSVFLSSMSHELRTPLNAILGFSNLMRKDPLLSQEQRENLDIINRSGDHLLTLINDVLEMAKIEAGRVQLESAPIDLGGMVRDITDMMHVRAQEQGLQLLVDQSSEFPRYIKGDEAHLRQVLINLVGNAVKFTAHGGVTVRFGMKPHAMPQRLLIEVEDSGVGIKPEDQPKIFEPFIQLGQTATQKGTGLGLTLTRQFVQLMGGTISVESTPGKGSTFRVELPVDKVAAADVVKPESVAKGEITGLAPGQPECRILIVEDQLENQLLLAKLMKSVGFPVKVAENGEQAVELFQSWRPQLIWMDRRMPVMDGLEATRRIRALPGGKEVKIVAVTASAFMEQRDEMLQAGMDDFVRKPYRFNEIYACLSKQLGVQYTYADEPAAEEVSDARLTAEMLAALPPEMRHELHDALESLEGERISAVIQQVASHDLKLHKTLSRLAENFDYPAILKALQAK